MFKFLNQTKEEQFKNRLYDAVRSRKRKVPNLSDEFTSMATQVSIVDDRSIQLRAYQIHQEKGGTALDNWLEAEQILRNSDSAVSGFLNEGNPNS